MKKRILLPLLILFAAALGVCACGEEPQGAAGELDKTSLSVSVGQEETLTFNLYEGKQLADGELVWTTSDESVAAVSSEQLTATVTGVSSGTAKIELKLDGETIASCDVEVHVSPLSVSVPTGKLVLIKNATATVRLKSTSPISDEDIVWESSDETIGTVEYQGRIAIVTAVKRGSCVITARCGNDRVSFTLIVGKT